MAEHDLLLTCDAGTTGVKCTLVAVKRNFAVQLIHRMPGIIQGFFPPPPCFSAFNPNGHRAAHMC